MRNASEKDVARAKATGKLEENVMYNWLGTKVHGKKLHQTLQFKIDSGATCQQVLVETDDGIVVAASLKNISAITKGPAQQPKKTRMKPRKGTRPETKIKMSADVKLEVGDMVLLENGERVRVTGVDLSSGNGGYPYMARYWYDREGKVTFYDCPSIYEGENITHKILPYQESAKEEKSPEQEAFEKGYWVSSNGKFPVFTSGVITEVLFSHGETSKNATGDEWAWGGQTDDKYYIVAYRKAKQ